MKTLDHARAHARSLARQERGATIAGVGFLVVGGLIGIAPMMIAGLVLIAAARRALSMLDRARSMVWSLELARDASEREESPVVVLAPTLATEPGPDPKGTPLAVRALAAAAVVTVIALLASFMPSSHAASPAKQRWTFIDDSFNTGEAWSIEHHEAATGGRALSKEAGSSAVLVAMSTPARDVRAMTRCKSEGDGCGLAFRIADDRHFVVARAIGERVELVHFDDGKESILASGKLPRGGSDVWQELAVEARGDIIRVSVNGVVALDRHDPRPAVAGSVGVWAPSRAWFDELSIETLAASPQAIEVLPFLRRPS